MTTREAAARVARIAIYGAANVRTPADYTLKEALSKMDKTPPKKFGKGEVIIDDGATGPIFEGEASE